MAQDMEDFNVDLRDAIFGYLTNSDQTDPVRLYELVIDSLTEAAYESLGFATAIEEDRDPTDHECAAERVHQQRLARRLELLVTMAVKHCSPHIARCRELGEIVAIESIRHSRDTITCVLSYIPPPRSPYVRS